MEGQREHGDEVGGDLDGPVVGAGAPTKAPAPTGSGDSAAKPEEGVSEMPSYLRSTEPEEGPPCYKVVRAKGKGRYVVATRFIPAGSVIVSERPLLISPDDPDKPGHVTCLGCCSVVTQAASVLCAGCGGPLCGARCEDSAYHLAECEAMQAVGHRFKPGCFSCNEYKLLSFLRVLLLEGETSTRCHNLEAHTERMRKDPRIYFQMSSLAPALIPPLAKYSMEERFWAFGVVETNVFNYSERFNKKEGYVLMDLISMVSHSCVCNAYGFCYHRPEGVEGWQSMEGLRKVLVAATDIQPGEEITVNYDHPHMPTAARQASLQNSKNFTCTCRRCQDPTELGLHTSTLCCEPCRARGVLALPVPQRAGSQMTGSRCLRCRRFSSAPGKARVASMNELDCIEREIVRLRQGGQADGMERLLEEQLFPKGRLHPTHELVLDAKYYLVTSLYDRVPGLEVPNLSEKQLTLMRGHCRDYLKAAAIAEPGYGLRMARVNLALCRAHLEMVKRSAQLPPSEATLEAMREAEECLQKAEVALRCSSDMRPLLAVQRQQAEHARRLIGWLGVLPAPSAAQPDDGKQQQQQQGKGKAKQGGKKKGGRR